MKTRQLYENDAVDSRKIEDILEPEVDLHERTDELTEALRVIFLWINKARTAKGLAARFSTLSSGLCIGDMDTISDIARHCGCSLPYCSQIAEEVEREFGIKHPSKQRSADALPYKESL